jgi:hypothetical protein
MCVSIWGWVFTIFVASREKGAKKQEKDRKVEEMSSMRSIELDESVAVAVAEEEEEWMDDDDESW